MKRNPLVSVLMAVYNGERLLKPTIESILNQTFVDFEFVIINDASTDSTRGIIETYKDSRIILHNNATNLGQTKSLNIGLRLARGKYIARIDAGDVSLPKRLEKQVAFMGKNKEIIVLGTSAVQYDAAGRILGIVHMPTLPKIILQRIFYACPVVHISVLMEKETIIQFGGYDENYDVLADYDLWSRLLQNNLFFGNLREVLVGYMVSPESFGSKNSMLKSIEEAKKIIQSNVNIFTDLNISLKEAYDIYRLLSLDMYGMSLNEIIESERLCKRIFKEIGADDRDTNYLMALRYLKYVLNNLKPNNGGLKWRYAVKRIFSKASMALLCDRFYDEILTKFFQSVLWRLKTNSLRLHFD